MRGLVQGLSRVVRRDVQIGMGGALAAVLFLMANLKLVPAGGSAPADGRIARTRDRDQFRLGALMTIGIGLYGAVLYYDQPAWDELRARRFRS